MTIDNDGPDGRIDRLQKLYEDIVMARDEYKELCLRRTAEGTITPYACPVCEFEKRRLRKTKRRLRIIYGT